jgi:hypothetical protein
MMQTEYVQINGRGMGFGRHRKHGEYEFGSIHHVKNLGEDGLRNDSLKKWLENGTLIAKTKEDFDNQQKKKSKHTAVLEEVEEEIVRLEGGKPVEKRNFPKKGELTKEDYWKESPRVGVKKRKCPQEGCNEVYGNMQGLFDCECLNLEEDEEEEESEEEDEEEEEEEETEEDEEED